MEINATDNIVDVLDRVLDKGIVVDAWVRLAPNGIDVTEASPKLEVESTEVHFGYGLAAKSAFLTPLKGQAPKISSNWQRNLKKK